MVLQAMDQRPDSGARQSTFKSQITAYLAFLLPNFLTCKIRVISTPHGGCAQKDQAEPHWHAKLAEQDFQAERLGRKIPCTKDLGVG